MSNTKLSTVAEELQELDFIFKSGSDLDVVERGYGRKLVQAISSQNEVLEREALKSLGDVYLHKANTSTGEAENFNKAHSLYTELLRYYTSLEEKEVVQHRLGYAEKCSKLAHQIIIKVPETNSGNSTSAVWTTLNKVKTKFKGYGSTPLIEGYTDSFVNGIIERNELLKIESLKSLGDLYLEKGKVSKDETAFTKSAGLYRAALDRCEDSDGRETLQHRIKYVEKVKEKERKERVYGPSTYPQKTPALGSSAESGFSTGLPVLNGRQHWTSSADALSALEKLASALEPECSGDIEHWKTSADGHLALEWWAAMWWRTGSRQRYLQHWKPSAETTFSTGTPVVRALQHWEKAVQHWNTSARLASALDVQC
ncbi:hypothetical protein Bbelb_372780 [Branchiostoma belcheri]|nr:hypothetical protein Bbelb_372780 [Branchiostoma belcheri]